MNKNVDKKFEFVKNLGDRDFWFYLIPLVLATIFLAGTAAYFSVFGLSKVFAGAKMPAIIMASAIEFGKIVAVSFTNKFWNTIGKLKGYLLAAIIVAMLVTSASIFGFLSDAYQKTADQLTIVNKKIDIENNKKAYLLEQISNYNKQSDLKSKRIDQLNQLRSNQESRLDSMYSKNWYSAARRVEIQISDASKEIIDLTSDMNNIANERFNLNDSINSIETRILEYNSTDASAELGPIIFVKDLFNTEMDKVVIIFIFMLIFVFDPMAMSLVIAVNKLLAIRYDKSAEPIKKKIPENIVSEDISNRSIEERYDEINNKTATSGLIVKSQIKDTDENNGQREA